MVVAPGRARAPRAFMFAASVLILSVAGVVALSAMNRREFSVSAHKYAYKIEGSDKPEIRVTQGDLVSITFSSEDIPHSFTIDEYRIMKRAEQGKPVSFDFVADKLSPPGGFRIRCTLTADSRCRELAAVLIVEPKK